MPEVVDFLTVLFEKEDFWFAAKQSLALSRANLKSAGCVMLASTQTYLSK